MSIFARKKPAVTVRPFTQADADHLLQFIATGWQVSLRISPLELKTSFRTMFGFVAEDDRGGRGFAVLDPRPPELAVIVAAGLVDTWPVKLFLDLLLPAIETETRRRSLTSLVYVGSAWWLIEELRPRKFETMEWIVILERTTAEPPPPPPAPAKISALHSSDIGNLIRLDALAFDHIWHKSTNNFAEAIAQGHLLYGAELDGRLVGYAWCEIHPRHAHLNRLAVRPDYQGRGIGAQLLHWTITETLARGVAKITLNTQELNHRSIALYQRFGFAVTNQRMPVLIKPLTASGIKH